jgi:hypothetical protein
MIACASGSDGVGRALARNAVVLVRCLCFSHHRTTSDTFLRERGGEYLVFPGGQTVERRTHAVPSTSMQAREDGDSA